jgi:hypothetical protein
MFPHENSRPLWWRLHEHFITGQNTIHNGNTTQNGFKKVFPFFSRRYRLEFGGKGCHYR